jgi:hypothetical protein
MTAKKRTTKSADAVILDVLGYEFPFHDRTEAERKVKRRLRYHGLGPYRQERVDLLRRFKDAFKARSTAARGPVILPAGTAGMPRWRTLTSSA